MSEKETGSDQIFNVLQGRGRDLNNRQSKSAALMANPEYNPYIHTSIADGISFGELRADSHWFLAMKASGIPLERIYEIFDAKTALENFTKTSNGEPISGRGIEDVTRRVQDLEEEYERSGGPMLGYESDFSTDPAVANGVLFSELRTDLSWLDAIRTVRTSSDVILKIWDTKTVIDIERATK